MWQYIPANLNTYTGSGPRGRSPESRKDLDAHGSSNAVNDVPAALRDVPYLLFSYSIDVNNVELWLSCDSRAVR